MKRCSFSYCFLSDVFTVSLPSHAPYQENNCSVINRCLFILTSSRVIFITSTGRAEMDALYSQPNIDQQGKICLQKKMVSGPQ